MPGSFPGRLESFKNGTMYLPPKTRLIWGAWRLRPWKLSMREAIWRCPRSGVRILRHSRNSRQWMPNAASQLRPAPLVRLEKRNMDHPRRPRAPPHGIHSWWN